MNNMTHFHHGLRTHYCSPRGTKSRSVIIVHFALFLMHWVVPQQLPSVMKLPHAGQCYLFT